MRACKSLTPFSRPAHRAMTTQALLKGTCTHNTARLFWRRQLFSRRCHTSARCSTIREVQKSLRNKERSACDVLEQYLHRLHSTEPTYHSFLTTDAATARNQVGCFALPQTLQAVAASSSLSQNLRTGPSIGPANSARWYRVAWSSGGRPHSGQGKLTWL